MQQVFFIPPVSAMELSECGTNNLFVIGQRYKKDENYRNYVHKAKEQGRFLILDNGVGDEGEVLTNKEVFELAKELQPNEVIPLDVLFNNPDTKTNCIEMAYWLDEAGLADKVHIFMCPQGDDIEDWIDCYKWALNYDAVATIGMSKKAIPYVMFKSTGDKNIAKARNMMFDILKERGLLKKPLHFLGSEGPTEYIHYWGEDVVRSTDSCVAIWQAFCGQTFDSSNYQRIPTPPNYFDLKLDGNQYEMAKKNIDLFKKIVL